ncbi:Uncharacterised protein [Bordetella pertussis]|nr:Uncharacterised protein [Bordetella pertussis]
MCAARSAIVWMSLSPATTTNTGTLIVTAMGAKSRIGLYERSG